MPSESIGNSREASNAILGHKYHQNHSNSVMSSEGRQRSFATKVKSVKGRVLSKQFIILPTSALMKRAWLPRK